MAHDAPLGCAPDEYDDLISGTCSHLPSRDDNNNKPSEDLSPYQLVQPNDLVMNKMKAWQGSIAISEYEGIVSPAYFVYQPNNSLLSWRIQNMCIICFVTPSMSLNI
ncbi:hypothetical protein M5585_29635 [Serratia ureilytica]